MATVDIELLNESLQRECRELLELTTPPRPDGYPPPPMPDPGTGPGFNRRRQTKSDREFWLRQRDRLLNTLGEKIAEGTVTF